MDELLEILEDIKPGVDFEKETALVDNGILDSLAIIRLVSEIGDEFDVEIQVTDLVPENFNSAKAIMNLINRLEDED
ncbi:MAG: phosphopantetheine-binding protein [Clostridium sp.]|nr:phosphopantetheine-binding protein [Clostridium sp.]